MLWKSYWKCWVNNLRLGTYCITCSNTILLLLCSSTSFPVASIPPPYHTWSGWMGMPCQAVDVLVPYIAWGCSESQNGSANGGGQTWSGVNGKCSDQVGMSCKCIHFIHSSGAHWLGSHSSHPFTNTSKCKTFKNGYPQTQTVCVARVCDEEKEAEWMIASSANISWQYMYSIYKKLPWYWTLTSF